MSTMTPKALEAVEVTDDRVTALQRGAAHAQAFYAQGRSTLIDAFSQEAWERWDASAEMVLVADTDDVELPEEIMHGRAA